MLTFEAVKISLSILLLFISFQVSAQKNLELRYGPELEFGKSMEYNEVVGFRKGKIYVLGSSAMKARNSINVSLDIYSEIGMDWLNGTVLVGNKSDVNFEKLLLVRDRILVFTSYYDRDLGLKVLMVQEYDERKNELGPSQRVDELSSDLKDEEHNFTITMSPDSNYILFYHDNFSATGNKVFNLKAINFDLTFLWEKELALNYKEKMVEFSQIIFDNSTNVYLLSSINPFGLGKTTGLGALVNVKSTLFTYRPYEDKLKEFEFTLSRNWIDEVSMTLDDQGRLVASAFYTYPNDYKIRGFILFEINTHSGAVESRKMCTLDKEQFRLIDESIGRLKEYSKMLVGSTGIYPGTNSHMNTTTMEFVKKGIYMAGDNLVVAVEAFRRDERCTESFSDQQMIVDCQKHFLYGDVILFFLDRECQVKKISQVVKMQHTVNKLNPYYSYSVQSANSSVFIFYNDDFRNAEESSDGLKTPLTNLNKSELSISVFSTNGDDIKYAVNGMVEEEIPFFPVSCASASPSEILLYFQKEKNYKFGKLSFH